MVSLLLFNFLVYKDKSEIEKKKDYLKKLYSKHFCAYKNKLNGLSTKTKYTECRDIYKQ
jgi:hypothetical protein